MIKSALIFLAMLDHSTPPDIAAGALLAAPLYGLESHTMAAYLVAGHPGGRYSGRCGDPQTIVRGTCGPYRLSLDRVRDYGAPPAVRDSLRRHRVLSALPAAHMLARARRVHHRRCTEERCAGWRIHSSASFRARASARARWKLARRMEVERALCGVLCRVAWGLP
jgi:hypothetical protein